MSPHLAVMPAQIEHAIRANPVIADVLGKWSQIGLPDCWLVAGVVVQSYWNAIHELSPLHGVSDVDLVYFDPDDLTERAESQHANRVNALFAELGVRFDVKNEARVHLWYEQRFGYAIEAYTSVEAAIETFPTTAGSIGIRPVGDRLEACAPFGFDDLLNLVVRANKRQITPEIYAEKVERWRGVWPRLDIRRWDEESANSRA